VRFVLWLTLTLPVFGCAPEPPPFDEVADVRQLMLTVLDPAADVYWDSVGTIMDLDGTKEIAPGTTAEWEAVRNAAMIVAESGNLLLTPGRAKEGEQWTELARALAIASSGNPRQRTGGEKGSHYQTLPSATRIDSPLTPLDSSDAKNAIISATSPGVATRPGG